MKIENKNGFTKIITSESGAVGQVKLNDEPVTIKVFRFKSENEWLFCCCSRGAFEMYNFNAYQHDDIIKGVSDDRTEAVEDFCVNYLLATGEAISIELDDFECLEYS